MQQPNESAEPGEQFEKFAVTRKLPLDKLPADRQQETGYCYRDKSTNACWEAWRAAEAYAASKLGRLRAERKVYAWQKRPDRCPECDSECFITSGGMNLTCYHCFLSEQTEKAEAERDGLREDGQKLISIVTAFMDAFSVEKSDPQAEKNAILHAYEMARKCELRALAALPNARKVKW